MVLIGPAGSGKSTLATSLFPADAILSSDAIRARIGSGEADQSVTGAAFAALHRTLEQRLGGGQTTLVDATSLTPAARRALLDRAGRAGATAVALVLDLPPELVRDRNAARIARVVPAPALTRQLEMLGSITDALLRNEGFAVVRRLRSPAEIAALRVVLSQSSA
ncbi:MAG: AAA family ATPase [Chloroflexi bacterium]|nr:AAA family ATPase [Chloroflexota bacterium]